MSDAPAKTNSAPASTADGHASNGGFREFVGKAAKFMFKAGCVATIGMVFISPHGTAMKFAEIIDPKRMRVGKDGEKSPARQDIERVVAVPLLAIGGLAGLAVGDRAWNMIENMLGNGKSK